MMRFARCVQRGVFYSCIAILILLLTSQAVSASPPAQVTSPTAVPQNGNAANGKALFVDDVKLANGGPPCISCHSINNVGILGGGAFGPDLTQASVRYGNAGLAAALADIQFPTMMPIFTRHPLTPTEAADLAAFIISAAGQPQVNKEGLILIVSLAGFLAAMVVAAVYWRGRLGGVRKALVERMRSTGSNSERRPESRRQQ